MLKRWAFSFQDISINSLPSQVQELRDLLCMVSRPAQVHCDGNAIKEFVSQINHRLYASEKKGISSSKQVTISFSFLNLFVSLTAFL